MNKGIIIVVAVLLVGGGVYAFTSGQSSSTKQEQMAMEEKMKMEEVKMMEEEMNIDAEAMKEKDMMNEASDAMMKKDDMSAEVSGATGAYVAYAPEKLAMAETGDVVLFFHASWCPSCRGLNANIEANSADIPAGVTILKVDYDKETELKRTYGVTTQHTLVQVDKDGNLIKKWSGGGTLAALVAEIE